MKKGITIIILIVLTTSVLNAQIPKKVTNAFDLKFKNAQNIKWAVDDGQYIVLFDHMEESKTAHFKSDGQWLKTIIPVEVKELKYCIKDHINQEYGAVQITEARIIKTPTSVNMVVLIFHLTSDNTSEKKKSDLLILTFSEGCKLLTAEKRGEENQ